MDLKDATPEQIRKRTIKHVNQSLQAIIYAFQSGKRIRDAPCSEQ